MCEGVESSAEKNILRGSGGDRLGELVFGVAAACNEESAKCYGEWTAFETWTAVWCALKDFFDMRAEDGNGDGVFEDERLRVKELVGCAPHSYAEGRT